MAPKYLAELFICPQASINIWKSHPALNVYTFLFTFITTVLGSVRLQASCGSHNTLRTMRMTSSKCVLQQRHLLGYVHRI